MKVKVVGYRDVNFTNKDGQSVVGVSLKTIFTPLRSDPKFFGMDVESVWLPDELVKSVGFIPSVGDDIELDYDYDGRRNILTGYRTIKK